MVRVGEDATIISSALKPDDLSWTESKAEKEYLVMRIETTKIGAMINGFDDYFLNLKAAISVLKALEETAPQ
jgi:hypothetical protein